MLIAFIVAGAILLAAAGLLCWLGAAAIRFAIRQLRAKALSLGRHMEETPDVS